MFKQSVFKYESAMSGPTVAVMAGVHGNEKAGVFALQKIIKELVLVKGTVYLIFANPPAIENNVRFIGKNLNRCFIEGNGGKAWEDARARELMAIFKNCDALLDLHGYNGPEDQPFIITDGLGLELASVLPFPVVISGFNRVGPGGTDSYMNSIGKIGLCAECGSNERPEDYVDLAERSVYRLLGYFGLIPNADNQGRQSQIAYRATQIVKRQYEDFKYHFPVKNFQELPDGKVFATDGSINYVAKPGDHILFPRATDPIGTEAFTLISKVKHSRL